MFLFSSTMRRCLCRVLLQVPSESRPLVVLLDGLDQLGTAHRAHSLAWLPIALPPHVRMLLSTLQQSDKHDLIHTLTALLSPWYDQRY